LLAAETIHKAERRVVRNLQPAAIRLNDDRHHHSYATRLAAIANRVVANAFALCRLPIVRQGSIPARRPRQLD